MIEINIPTLEEIYVLNIKDGWPDKGNIHSYIDVYMDILRPYRTSAKNILEIGILNGQSLLMWEQYFNGKVYGIDCTDQPIDGRYDLRTLIAEETHNIIIMDATSEKQVRHHFKETKFDVIIDDASHQLEHQIQQFSNFYPLINKDGIYIIEDIQSIDTDREHFMNLAFDVEILDRRKIKNRYDDVMCIIRK